MALVSSWSVGTVDDARREIEVLVEAVLGALLRLACT